MRRTAIVTLTLVMVFLVADAWGAKKRKLLPSMVSGSDPVTVAAGLLDVGREQAGDGTWQRLRVARVYYLMGDRATGQAIIDEVTGRKPDASDWIRVGRIYYEAGEWDKAKPAFERVLREKPKDEDWLAEIGAYFNLQGDRARAEELFARSIVEDAENHHNAAMMAGSYVGVVPDP
jgi:tetratricopeptide (TPR) repeat protein